MLRQADFDPSRALRRAGALALCALTAALPVTPAFSAPSGEQVVQGEATFSQDGNTTIIDTTTHETIVQYDQFDIYQDEIVQINQPSADSRILNHVPHGDPSVVDGSLFSNGLVYIVNPAGVFIGDTAILDVGGLVAAAGDLSYEDFLAGEDRFTALRGDVEVAGGALVRADHSVALLGRRVANYGTVIAEGGMVAFVAGENAVLGSLDGHLIVRVDGGGEAPGEEAGFALTQAGTVDAGGGRVTLSAGDTYSLAMNHTGVTRGRELELYAGGDGLVQVAGSLDASGSDAGETGGSIHVIGGRVAVLDARLDASGDAGGGEILVGGDLHGTGDATARRTFVGSDAQLVADALSNGDGGRIVVWADEATGFYGQASARGGEVAGDGGFIEISGRRFLEARGHQVDLSAPNGDSGTLLYDPAAIVIVGGEPVDPVVDGSDSDADPEELVGDSGAMGQILEGSVGNPDANEDPVFGDAFVIYESEIEDTDADIVLQAEHTITTDGTFTDDTVVVVAGNSLVLQTTGNGVDADGNPVEYAIDLDQAVTWQVSDGGLIYISTDADTLDVPEGEVASAGIRVGDLEFLGRAFASAGGVENPLVVSDPDLEALGILPEVDTAVTVRSTMGDIVVGNVVTDGLDGANAGLQLPSPAARVDIRAMAEGDIELGSISAVGGSAFTTAQGMGEASPGVGGFGGSITVRTADGNIVIHDGIDVSGGDGVSGLPQPPDSDELQIQGNGGAGGFIDIDAERAGDSPTGVVTITGDLIADGGRGQEVAGVEVADGLIAPLAGLGGVGGAVQVSAASGIVVEGSTVSASGGDGIGGGGSVVSQIASIVLETQVPAESDESGPGIQLIDSDIRANGGDVEAGGPGGSGGMGGAIRIAANNGVLDASTSFIQANGGDGLAGPVGGEFSRDGAGGNLFSVVVQGRDGVLVGGIQSLGGDSQNATGAIGGDVDISSALGSVETVSVMRPDPDDPMSTVVHGIDVSGGSATEMREEEVGVAGGSGGRVEIQTDDDAPVRGDVVLGSSITAFGGTGTEIDEDGMVVPDVAAAGGSVDISAARAIGASPTAGTVRVEGGSILLDAPIIGRDVDADGVVRLLGFDLAGTDADADQATLQASESIETNVAGDGTLEHVTVVHTDQTATTALSIGGAAALEVAAGVEEPTSTNRAVDPGPTRPPVPQTITLMQNQAAGAPELNFVLDAIPADDLSGAENELHIEDGAVVLGDAGGSITNLDGALSGGSGGGLHIATTGDVQLAATSIGAGAPLRIEGDSGALLGLDANGDVEIDLQGASAFGAIDVVQASAQASTTLASSAGGSLDTLEVRGDPDETLAPVQVMTGSTSAGTSFAYQLDAFAITGGSAPALRVEDLTLGGNGQLTVRGDLRLEGGEMNPSSNPNIGFQSGSVLTLDAGGDIRWVEGDNTVAIQQQGAADPASLVLLAGGSVGSDQGGALVTSGVAGGVLQVAARFGGDFRLLNTNGELHIANVAVPDATDPSGEALAGNVAGIAGLQGSGGSVDLENQDGPIVLGAMPTGVGQTPPIHVFADGDVIFQSDVLIENAQFVPVPEIVDGQLTGETELVATHSGSVRSARGGVVFAGSVDTGSNVAVDEEGMVDDEAIDATLVVEAGGFVDFTQDVGAAGALARLDTTAARLPEGASPDEMREFHVAEAIFRGGLQGPAGARFVRPAPNPMPDPDDPEPVSRVAFGGDVGGQTALYGLDVEADEIAFSVIGSGSAEVVSAGDGGIQLDTGQSSVPPVATITDVLGNLAISTSGSFAVGDLDKLSAVGSLSIHADQVQVGDLSAAGIAITSPEIAIMAREGAPVLLQDGSTVTDAGVDWVANSIQTSSTPVPDDPDAPVTFFLGSGGIDIPGDVSRFEVRRLNTSQDRVDAGSFVGPDAVVLDLTGNGPLLVGDPAREMERSEPLELPTTLPRFGTAQPAGPVQVGAAEVLAFLRCSSVYAAATAGSPCSGAEHAALASVKRIGDTALATPRADEVTARYQELVAGPGAKERLRTAFAAAGSAFAATREWRDGTLDGAELYRFLAGPPQGQSAALASVRELAWLFAEIEMMGLTDADTRQLRETLAQEFAAAADLPGLSADAVIAAVAASPVGLVSANGQARP